MTTSKKTLKQRRAAEPLKAYENTEFLNSPEARVLRMIAEFVEPQRRFRRAGVKDTIVFFGSARILPRKNTNVYLTQVRQTLSRIKRPTKAQLQTLRDAQMASEMSSYYEDCVVLAKSLTQWSMSLRSPNRFVVCSGGGPGIMEAANRGATLAGGKSIGMNISLPFEQFSNPYVMKDLNFEFHYFFMRKFWFVYLAKALVIFPGGFGTMDELMEVLTLLQTEKIKKKMTVVIYGRKYWEKMVDFEQMVQHGVISRSDLALFKFCDDPQEAFEYLKSALMKHYPTT